jgi:hypothetical protein
MVHFADGIWTGGYGLNYGGHVGNRQVVFSVQFSSLLEALDVLQRQSEAEE